MKKRMLGNTGISVSEIGLGAWQIINPDLNGADRADAIRLVHAALDAGCNFIDTAPNYARGMSEDVLGEALKGRRQDVVLCTKFGHHNLQGAPDFRPEVVRGVLAESCRRMKTDYIDLLLVHSPPRELMDGRKAETLYAELEALKNEGTIRAYGVSLDWKEELETVMRSTGSQACEVMYNAFYQESEGAFTEAGERGVGLVVKVPLDSGWLSGRYGRNSRFEDIRTRWSPEIVERRGRLVERLMEFLPEGMSLSRLALQFCLARQEVSSVIPGAKSTAQALENIGAANGTLRPEIVEEIRNLWNTEIANSPLPW